MFALLALGVQGCAGGGCSDVGGFDGITVEIPRALFVSTGTLSVAVCDGDECATAAQPLGPVPEGPVGRSSNITFEDLGRRFDPGPVTSTVELSKANGKVIATAERDAELKRSYPNGQSCDGDGYVVGTVALNPRDDRHRMTDDEIDRSPQRPCDGGARLTRHPARTG